MPRCKALEILRNEAYWEYAAMTRDEGNEADGRFSAAFDLLSPVPWNSGQRGPSVKFVQLIFKIPDGIVDPNQFRV